MGGQNNSTLQIGCSRVGSAFSLVFYYFEVVRLSGLELLAIGPGDQEWVVLFLDF